MKKTTAIICDNHKLSKFQEELKAHDFDDLTTLPYSGKDGISIIKVNHDSKNTFVLKEVVEDIERHFKRLSKNKKR